jgi:uncharacterized protein YllA (UPF0747 family)
MILLRNSFMLVDSDTAAGIRSLGFELNDMFKTEKELSEIIVRKRTLLKIELAHEKDRLTSLYNDISGFASAVDKSLSGHVSALGTQAIKKIENLEKKMMRAEKRKFDEDLRRLLKMRDRIFPNGILQERVDNFLPYYAMMGKDFFSILYSNSGCFEQMFCTLELP